MRMQAEIIAQMGAQLFAAGIDMDQAVNTAAALLKKAQECETILDSSHLSMSLYASQRHLTLKAETFRHQHDGTPYDVVNIGDITLFMDREQVVQLRDLLSGLIDSEAKTEAA